MRILPRKSKALFPIEIFVEQIAKIKKEFGLNRTRFEEELGIKNTGRWGREVKSIDMDTALWICQKFAKSLDWLIFGKESPPSLEEFASEQYDGRPLETLETILLFEVLEKVEEVAIKQRQKLSVRQTARLAALVYEHCRREREQPDELLVEKYLLLKD